LVHSIGRTDGTRMRDFENKNTERQRPL